MNFKKLTALILVAALFVVNAACSSKDSIESEVTIETSKVTTAATSIAETTEATTTTLETTEESIEETQDTDTSYSIYAPHEISEDQIYFDVGDHILSYWVSLIYFDQGEGVFLRETSSFNETMMLEIIMNSALTYDAHLHRADDDEYTYVCQYCHSIDVNLESRPDHGFSMEYLKIMLSNFFDEDIDYDEIARKLEPGSLYGTYYNDEYNSVSLRCFNPYSLHAEITDTNISDNYYSYLVDFTYMVNGNVCTYNFFWVDEFEEDENHYPRHVSDIATITVTYDMNDEYALGFQITDINVDITNKRPAANPPDPDADVASTSVHRYIRNRNSQVIHDGTCFNLPHEDNRQIVYYTQDELLFHHTCGNCYR